MHVSRRMKEGGNGGERVMVEIREVHMYLREVANDVKSERVILSHDVEKERVCVVVECLVIQKQFG